MIGSLIWWSWLLMFCCCCWCFFFWLLLIEGDKKRTERAELNSANGDTAESHDQFYRDHKLLLVLFRALAVMPITRSAPGLYGRCSLHAFQMYLWECMHFSLSRDSACIECDFHFYFHVNRKSDISLEIIGHHLCHIILYCNDRCRVLCGSRTHSHSRRNKEIRRKDLRIHFCHIFSTTLLGKYLFILS